jgi:hypothetical protein
MSLFLDFLPFPDLYLLALKSSSISVLTKHKYNHLAVAKLLLCNNSYKPIDLRTFHTQVFWHVGHILLPCTWIWFWLHSCHISFWFGYSQCHFRIINNW